MRIFVYIALIVILASFVFNLMNFEYDKGILAEVNRPYIIGLGSGICGLILCFIFLRFFQIHSNSKSE